MGAGSKITAVLGTKTRGKARAKRRTVAWKANISAIGVVYSKASQSLFDLHQYHFVRIESSEYWLFRGPWMVPLAKRHVGRHSTQLTIILSEMPAARASPENTCLVARGPEVPAFKDDITHLTAENARLNEGYRWEFYQFQAGMRHFATLSRENIVSSSSRKTKI